MGIVSWVISYKRGSDNLSVYFKQTNELIARKFTHLQ